MRLFRTARPRKSSTMQIKPRYLKEMRNLKRRLWSKISPSNESRVNLILLSRTRPNLRDCTKKRSANAILLVTWKIQAC